MDSERWRQMSQLYHAALAQDASRRAAFLADACGNNEGLRQELEALIASDADVDAFLEALAREIPPRPVAGIDGSSATSATLAGQTLGRYRIVERIGSGGMGEVYRAFDAQLDRHVAIKVLLGGGFDDPTSRARLIREARTASKLNHPNICTIHDVGEADGRAYIAMELVDGQSLSVRLAAGPMDAGRVVGYARQLVDALAHAHERGVVHRDLKSANIVITLDDRVKVLDFGLAKQIAGDDATAITGRPPATLTAPGVLVGTLAYMAPEQLRGHPADTRSDIWALGVVLYEMAAGRLPFTGATPFEIIAAILNSPAPPLRDAALSSLSVIVSKCLEKDPGRRYARAADIRAALEEHVSRGTRVRRWLAVRPRVAAAVATLTTAAALAMATALDVGGVRQWADRLFSEDVIAFADRDWLLVASFQNHTSDPVFDRSLDTALSVALGQSSYVNVVSPSRIQAALQRMRVDATRHLDAATARDLAQREGIKLVLVPAIAEVGGVYQLSGSLEDPATGSVLRSAAVRARRKEDVLNGIDELIARIRNDLGEARRAISQQSRPLAQVTTPSLEALKVFSLGRAAHQAARIDEARGLYEEALRLDPSFTGARASLGILNFELRDREKGKELIAQSIKDVDALTDRERTSIVAFHAEAIENNLQKAADAYVSLLAIYPDSAAAHNNLGRVYMNMGRYEEAARELKEAIRIEPDVMLTYNSLNQVYLSGLGDLDAAIALAQQQLVRNDQTEFGYDNLGWAWLGKGELALAREAFEKALAANPRATLDLFRLGHTYRLEGRYREARETFLKIPSIDTAEYTAYYDAGVAAQLMGDETGARAHFATFRRLVDSRLQHDPKNAALRMELALALGRLGDARRARAAAERALTLDPTRHFDYAGFLAQQGRTAEAVRQLQLAVERGYRNFVWMKIHQDLAPLASEPAFRAILAKGLKE